MNREKTKRSKKQDGGEIDRLSALPDNLICHILSFIPTKYSVATSILSTRWKNLFASVPVIDLDHRLRLRNKRKEYTPRSACDDFVSLASNVILFPNTTTLDSFRLRCGCFKDAPSTIYMWVYSIVLRKVQVIDIHVALGGSDIPLPPELLSCKTLVTLKLRGRFDLDVEGLTCLPNLKKVNLELAILNVSKLISGCQVLEELRLFQCIMNDNPILDISSPSLKKLIITNLDYYYLGKRSLAINAPNLMFFEYVDCVAKSYNITNLNSLFEARISVYLGNHMAENELPHKCQLVSKFICDMNNVNQIFLCGDSLQALYGSDSPLPLFMNLIGMELEANDKSGCLALPKLLESSPNLTWLSFPKGLLHKTHESHSCLPNQVPMCLSLSLHEIKINDFEARDYEFGYVKYFLQYGQVLEKVSIWLKESVFSSNYSSIYKRLSKYSILSLVCERLTKCSRSSEIGCQIVVCFKKCERSIWIRKSAV